MIGIMGAMPEEINQIEALIQNKQSTELGNRIFHHGLIHGKPVVVVFSRWGKVAASATAATLIHHFNISELVFTGVAGGLSSDVSVGDIVIADKLVQHDMDARPLFAQFQIPLTDNCYFHTGAKQLQNAQYASDQFLTHHFHESIPKGIQSTLNLKMPKIHVGTVASGDQFISCAHKSRKLASNIDALLAVEMEGAAIAQVCHEFNCPFTVIRTISDDANHDAPIDFQQFVDKVAAKYSAGIVSQWLKLH